MKKGKKRKRKRKRKRKMKRDSKDKNEIEVKKRIKELITVFCKDGDDVCTNDIMEWIYQNVFLTIEKNLVNLNRNEILENLKTSQNKDVYYVILHYLEETIPNFKKSLDH